MKKNMIIWMGLALVMLSVGAITVSASEPLGRCADNQSIQQFQQETDPLRNILKFKESELQQLNYIEGFDMHKASAIQADIAELKSMINASATKFKIPPCNRS